MSHSRSLTILLVSAAVLAALTGCSVSGGGAGGASGGASGSSSTAPSTPTKAAGMTAIPAACPDQAEVSSDLGLSVTGGGADASSGCLYFSAGGRPPGVSINFGLTAGLTPDAAVAKLKSEEPTSPAFGPVPGVGDAAYYDTLANDSGPGSYLVVLSGQVGFHIVVTTVISKDKYSALANDIITGK